MSTNAKESPFPTSSDELIFPSASQDISHTLNFLRRTALSSQNRLRSILHDSQFVQNVASTYQLPLVANERCGSWYIPPAVKKGSVYFKSTDGHTGQWAFSLRRLNLHLLDIVDEHGGCIVVDSTRRGKAMPDALSKTMPIWCAVINRLLFGEVNISLPVDVIGASENAQIMAKVAGWAKSTEVLQLDIQALRKRLRHPLRPLWITPNGSINSQSGSLESHYPVICCTASRRVRGSEASEDGYIQGAADDSESWALGLTPRLFWEHKKELLETAEEDLPALIKELNARLAAAPAHHAILIRPTQTLHIGTIATVSRSSFDGIIVCNEDIEENASEAQKRETKKVLNINCGTGKLGSRALRTQLPRLIPFVAAFTGDAEPPKLLFSCRTGKDLSAGVALAILCMYFDNQGDFQPDLPASRKTLIDKDLIRHRLSWITTSEPSINPSRATLQAVNAFLMPRP